jgi:hypothetical protein
MNEPKKGPEKLILARKNKTGSSSSHAGSRHSSTGSIISNSESNTPTVATHAVYDKEPSPLKLTIVSSPVAELNDNFKVFKTSDSIDSFVDYSSPKRATLLGGTVSNTNTLKSPLKEIPEQKSYFGTFLSAVGAVSIKPKKEDELTQDEENDLFLLNVYEKNKIKDTSPITSGSRTSWFVKQYQSTKKLLVEEFVQVLNKY